jgi:hypothetical protein
VQYLSQGSAGLQAASDGAVKFGVNADTALIAKARAFDEAWDKSWANWKAGAKSSFLSAESGLTDLLEWWRNKVGSIAGPTEIFKSTFANGGGTRMTQADVNSFYQATGADKKTTGTTQDPDVIKAAIANAQPLLGPLGKLPTAKEAKEKDSDKTRKAA